MPFKSIKYIEVLFPFNKQMMLKSYAVKKHNLTGRDLSMFPLPS